MMNLKGFRRK